MVWNAQDLEAFAEASERLTSLTGLHWEIISTQCEPWATAEHLGVELAQSVLQRSVSCQNHSKTQIGCSLQVPNPAVAQVPRASGLRLTVFKSHTGRLKNVNWLRSGMVEPLLISLAIVLGFPDMGRYPPAVVYALSEPRTTACGVMLD